MSVYARESEINWNTRDIEIWQSDFAALLYIQAVFQKKQK